MSAETPTSETEDSVASTAFRSELPLNRPAPRAFGVGRYGPGKFDDRDNTRYSWVRALPAITALVLGFLVSAPAAHATNPYCESADASTSLYDFCKPDVDAEGANRWGDKINSNFDQIEEAIAAVNASTSAPFLSALNTSTQSLDSLKFPYTGGVLTGFVTAPTYSSAPVVIVSTISAPGILNFYTAGGFNAARFNSDGTARFNLGSFSGSALGDMELFSTGPPDFYFRRNDTTINAQDTLGGFWVRDQDESTGGSTVKAGYQFTAEGSWASGGGQFETAHRWSSSRRGGTEVDFMVLSSTGLLVMGWPGATIETVTACGTCTLQIVSPSGSGVGITGGLTADGLVRISTGSTAFFAANAGFTTTATSFTGGASVTGSTIAFTVVGTTVACWLTGSATNSGAADIKVGFGVDATANTIPGTSVTVGVLVVSVSGNNGNISVPPIEFQVTPGQHTFRLGLWGSAGTVTFPAVSADAIAQFGCREVTSR